MPDGAMLAAATGLPAPGGPLGCKPSTEDSMGELVAWYCMWYCMGNICTAVAAAGEDGIDGSSGWWNLQVWPNAHLQGGQQASKQGAGTQRCRVSAAAAWSARLGRRWAGGAGPTGVVPCPSIPSQLAPHFCHNTCAYSRGARERLAFSDLHTAFPASSPACLPCCAARGLQPTSHQPSPAQQPLACSSSHRKRTPALRGAGAGPES